MLDLSEKFGDLSESAVRAAPISSLAEQEISILQLFAAGKNSAEIAESLHISLRTLRNHLHHVNQKLRTHNRLEAVMNAIHRKLI
jgi:DNA-binding CsgD family transcriptional regulator